jgi:hypothetical protein
MLVLLLIGTKPVVIFIFEEVVQGLQIVAHGQALEAVNTLYDGQVLLQLLDLILHVDDGLLHQHLLIQLLLGGWQPFQQERVLVNLLQLHQHQQDYRQYDHYNAENS